MQLYGTTYFFVNSALTGQITFGFIYEKEGVQIGRINLFGVIYERIGEGEVQVGSVDDTW